MCVKAVEVRLVVVNPQLLSTVELKQALTPISWEMRACNSLAEPPS